MGPPPQLYVKLLSIYAEIWKISNGKLSVADNLRQDEFAKLFRGADEGIPLIVQHVRPILKP